jgi:branched-chain amino acid transport system ATP-binding protein
MNILEIKSLRKAFGGLMAVDAVSFNVRAGGIKALIGPNGSGKTTTFNLISGVFKPTSGSIVFDGHEITNHKPYRVCDLGVGRTFQTTQLFGDMSIMDNLMLARHSKTRAELFATAFTLPLHRREEKICLAKCYEILEFLGLGKIDAAAPATSLPFGVQRTIEIGRAIASEPKIILMDEPAAGLNAAETNSLSQLLYKIRDRGITLLLIEHDMNLVMKVAEDITVLNYGKVIAEGKPKEIQTNPEVVKAYLGA